MIRELTDEQADALADAIIIQAVQDFRDAKILKKYANGLEKSVGQFLNSEWAGTLGRGADLEKIHQRLKTEAPKDADLKKIFQSIQNCFEKSFKHIMIAEDDKICIILGANPVTVRDHKDKILNLLEDLQKHGYS